MAFRVLIIGGRQRFEYARLRDALDALLANRLPDVEILTTGSPGVPAIAACYAAERKLKLTTLPLDNHEHRGDAEEWRDQRLVEMAHAAVLVGPSTEVRSLLDAASVKGLGIVAPGTRSGTERRTVEPTPEEDGGGMVRGLPD